MNKENRFMLQKLRKTAALLLAAAFILCLSGQTAVQASALPYDCYNYDYRKYIHFTPAAYVPERTLSGADFFLDGESIGMFSSPQDICKAPDGRIFIADTGNNRIVILTPDMKKAEYIITGFENGEKEDRFNQPAGVCVSEKGNIYIADSENKRIVELDPDYRLLQIVSDPQSESFEPGFVFTPVRVAVDYADRIYCIAKNMFEGIMVFETGGDFTGFFGTIDVPISLWEKFWKRIATKEERTKQQLFIPTEFTGIDVDPDGFVYASNIDAKGEQGVRRLNPGGIDVIRKGTTENLGGDLITDGSGDYFGPSQFIDVVYRGNGIYSCLDRFRGRIFTYDHEGNLLYIFGGLGTQEGTFTLPAAIEQVGDSLAVIDATRGTILCFKATEYGRLINEAVSLRYDGDETQAVDLWKRVLLLDENNELANVGIGKAYLTAGDYALAMKYLKIGMNSDYYSIAYKRYRNDILTRNASYVLTGILVLVVGLFIYKKIKQKRRGEAADA